jgi:hypothetical protein
MSVTAPPSAPSATTYLAERLLARRVQREVVQAAALEHREGMPEALFFQVDRHPCPEDALVEADQPVQVGRDELQVMDVVEQ